MIELNCSYEESKKILELGYDFSKVCWKSLYEYRDQYNLNKKLIKLHLHGTHLSLACIEDEIKRDRFGGKYGIVDLVVPIIPKAALEACLPLIEGVIWKRFPAAGDGLLRSTGLNHKTVETCTGFHEFLWCHENYPEELKKKFDEVMG